ncbi:MAG: ABC transporter ATP-binding protein [Firmicutes bacterium]|nr:ABC transporter ATP-binding protein [Bacillota bacterium]
MSIVTTSNLCVGYDKKTVVAQVNLQIRAGEVLGLLGPNGAGKTTILRTIAGLLPPVLGEVYIKGHPLSQLSEQVRARMMAVVLTDRSFQGQMTVFDILAMGRYPHTNMFGRLRRRDMQIITDAVETVSGSHLVERTFNELSDGEKQKVFLARALVQEPKLIVMDEPTAFLDIQHKVELMRILAKLRNEKGISVVLSLHEIDIAMKCSNTVMLVGDGRILGCGHPEDLVKEKEVHQLYHVSGATYDEIFCTLEEPDNGLQQVFVVGGAGKGTPIYRALRKRGVGICTGILQENDLDYRVAKSLGGTVCSELAYEDIRQETYEKAVGMVNRLPILVDSGFPIGRSNHLNLELIRHALRVGKTVFSLRERKLCQQLYGWGKLVSCVDIADMISHFPHGSIEKSINVANYN